MYDIYTSLPRIIHTVESCWNFYNKYLAGHKLHCPIKGILVAELVDYAKLHTFISLSIYSRTSVQSACMTTLL